jgi:hypothetical protein
VFDFGEILTGRNLGDRIKAGANHTWPPVQRARLHSVPGSLALRDHETILLSAFRRFQQFPTNHGNSGQVVPDESVHSN